MRHRQGFDITAEEQNMAENADNRMDFYVGDSTHET